MLLVKAPKGSYISNDIFEDGTKLVHLTTQKGVDYYADKEYMDKCKVWDKEVFARMNSNVSFRSAYQKVYNESKVLTAIWLNSALNNVDTVKNFEDIAEVLDLSVTVDKTRELTQKPQRQEVHIEPLPDLDIFQDVEEYTDEDEISVVPTTAELTIKEDEFEPVDVNITSTIVESNDIYKEEEDVLEPFDDIFGEEVTAEVVETPVFIEEEEVTDNYYTEPPTKEFEPENSDLDIFPDDVEVDIIEVTPPPSVIVQQVKEEKPKDVVFTYDGKLPTHIVKAILPLIESGLSTTVTKEGSKYNIEISRGE